MRALALPLCLAACGSCSSEPNSREDTKPASSTAPTSKTDPTPVARGERLLGLAFSDRQDGDFNAGYAQALDAGVQATSLPLAWDDIEKEAGVYALEPDFLDIAVAGYAPRGTRLMLELNPIDTNNVRVPSYLKGTAWDDPKLVAAFKGLLDWALPKVAKLDLVALSIGNEIDITLATEADWLAYQSFLQQVSQHAISMRPGLRVGTKITFAGLIGAHAASAAKLTEVTDLVITTYYPLNHDFTIKPPSSVAQAFDELTTRFPKRPILVAEIGTPSSTECGSSESLQADFVREAFRAWDTHAGQIELLEFVWQHDVSEQSLGQFEAYYGISSPCFLAYLGTLGLRTHPGKAKPAWITLAEEAKLRGW